MTPGASYYSQSAIASWFLDTGTPDANYPVANLGDLVNITKVGRFTPASGQVLIRFTFPYPVYLGFIGFIAHNVTGGAAYCQVQLYDGPGITGSLVYNVVNNFWPSSAPVTGYPSVRPIVLPSLLTVQSGYLAFATMGAGMFELGGVDFGRWLSLAAVGPGKEVGFANRLDSIPLIGGGSDGSDTPFLPRIMNGEIPMLALDVGGLNDCLDFQTYTHRSNPFTYVEDADDPTCWARRCFLARNRELAPSVGRVYRRDRFQLRFIEHRR